MTPKERPVKITEPAITMTAKDFLVNSNNSSNYARAAEKTVREAMAAIEARIERRIRSNRSMDDSSSRDR